MTVVVTAGTDQERPSESVKESVPESVYTCVPARESDVRVPVVAPAVAPDVYPMRISVPVLLLTVQMLALPEVYATE